MRILLLNGRVRVLMHWCMCYHPEYYKTFNNILGLKKLKYDIRVFIDKLMRENCLGMKQ